MVEKKQILRDRAKTLFGRLEAIGLKRTPHFAFGDTVWFDPMPRILVKDLPNFVRVVRAVTLLERAGAVYIDIDRRGKSIAWRIPLR